MTKPTSAVKRRYNEKAYDRIEISVPKGQKEIIKAHAEAQGESTTAFIQRAIETAMRIDSLTPIIEPNVWEAAQAKMRKSQQSEQPPAPLGYKWQDGKLVIDEETAEEVRNRFNKWIDSK